MVRKYEILLYMSIVPPVQKEIMKVKEQSYYLSYITQSRVLYDNVKTTWKDDCCFMFIHCF